MLAFGLRRPPGHHATADQFGGYCYLNNAAITAQQLLEAEVGRVGILDIDYHDSNGAQDIFYDRGDVLYCSIHKSPEVELPYLCVAALGTNVAAALEGFGVPER